MTASQMLRSSEAHELICMDTIGALANARVPFLVGGTFALVHYTGQSRVTKDLDIMLRREEVPAAFEALASVGFETSLPYPHWLGKATRGEFVIDLIFASGNGVARVDEEWFTNAEPAVLFDREVRVSPAEELVWSKAFVMERERYDGADVAHLLWARGRTLDWDRLERRFGEFLPVLFLHVVEFLFVYSDGADRLPPGRFAQLQERAAAYLRPDGRRVCRGTLLSRAQYRHDVIEHGYADGRVTTGAMSPEDVEIWTAAIDD
jgi:hypothetical protein